MASSSILGRVDQLSMEIHFKQHSTNRRGAHSGVDDIFGLFNSFESNHLYPFSSEVNHNTCGHFSQKPWAIEYTFVNPRSDAMRKFVSNFD
jgi:hypothetical protein